MKNNTGTTHLLSMPRLPGTNGHRIDYRHLSASLVRKPGAFAHYRYRDDLFPSLVFRRAYDALGQAMPTRADREYVRLLHLAATTAETLVEAALNDLLTQSLCPTFDAVRDRVRQPATVVLPTLATPVLDLRPYDALLGGGPVVTTAAPVGARPC